MNAAESSGDGSGQPEPDRSFRSFMSFQHWPEPLAPEAFHGLAGEIVHTIEPHSEADPAALLIQLLLAFGSVVGRAPHFVAEADRHGINLFAVLVGETSKARKGSSWGHIKALFSEVDPTWAKDRLTTGLSSGEGLIEAVSDSVVTDKRLLVVEPELASTLRVMGREGSTLSPTVRHAWDSGNLSVLTKKSPSKATAAHISIVGHITRDELRRYLDRTEAGNGFANRFLFLCVRRSKPLPEGGNLDPNSLSPLVENVKNAANFARSAARVPFDDEARIIWRAVYEPLSDGKPGLLGSVIGRAEAQVVRLACVYALLDRSAAIRRQHLLGAIALWDYCEASARHVFGDALGDPIADELLAALRNAPNGLTRTEIRDHFGRNKTGDQIDRGLSILLDRRLAYYRADPAGSGRPAERWFATKGDTTKTTKTTKGGLRSYPSYLDLAKRAMSEARPRTPKNANTSPEAAPPSAGRQIDWDQIPDDDDSDGAFPEGEQ